MNHSFSHQLLIETRKVSFNVIDALPNQSDLGHLAQCCQSQLDRVIGVMGVVGRAVRGINQLNFEQRRHLASKTFCRFGVV